MSKNRKNQAASIRFGPALKALFLCLVVAGSAVGYVWQKSQIYQLGRDIRQQEAQLKQLRGDNERLANQLSILRSPVMLDGRVRQLNLGLTPAQPSQIYRVQELPAPDNKNPSPRFAGRTAGLAD